MDKTKRSSGFVTTNHPEIIRVYQSRPFFRDRAEDKHITASFDTTCNSKKQFMLGTSQQSTCLAFLRDDNTGRQHELMLVILLCPKVLVRGGRRHKQHSSVSNDRRVRNMQFQTEPEDSMDHSCSF